MKSLMRLHLFVSRAISDLSNISVNHFLFGLSWCAGRHLNHIRAFNVAHAGPRVWYVWMQSTILLALTSPSDCIRF